MKDKAKTDATVGADAAAGAVAGTVAGALPNMVAPEIVVPKMPPLPSVERVVLDNGLPVHLLRNPGQEVVRVSVVWAAGSAVQTAAGLKPFTASATLNLLAEGSMGSGGGAGLSAHEIAERLDFVGSYYDVTVDRDYAVATFCCLEKFLEPTLEVASEILIRPAFPEDEVSLYARKRMERLAVERAKPATKAREMFSAALFGDAHPYGVSSPESEYLGLRREDATAFWSRFYGAENCFAVCSLSDDPAQREAVSELLGRLPARSMSTSGDYAMPAPVSDGYRFLPMEGAVQSAVRIGRVLFPRHHPDFVGMQVVATILGGYFGSRLVKVLREQMGYTYGVMAAMVNLRESGYLAIATEVTADATADAVERIFAEMGRLKTELVTEDELDTVRRSMLGDVMRILDGPFGIVDVVIENIQIGGETSGLPGSSGVSSRASDGASECKCDYLADFVRQVETITPGRVMELAQKYLDREAFTVVIVGKE
ncbi:MAG: insulinase family protein [Alistipes sp.]|jgi:predicted Zn-dependent peptidase|nr:insulinase family protein [Alistipes sp.]